MVFSSHLKSSGCTSTTPGKEDSVSSLISDHLLEDHLFDRFPSNVPVAISFLTSRLLVAKRGDFEITQVFENGGVRVYCNTYNLPSELHFKGTKQVFEMMDT